MACRSAQRIRAAAVIFAISTGACTNPLPDAAKEHMRRGEAALADGKFARAIAAYGYARELAPTSPEVQRAMMRARAFAIADSEANVNLERAEDAFYEISLLLETDPANSAVYLTALGNISARKGDREGAKARFAEAVEKEPSSSLPRLALGLLVMESAEDAALARAELERVLKIRPNDFRALLALGELRLATGDIPAAVANLEAALRNGDSFELRMALGRVRALESNAAEAARCFLRATELNPKSPEAFGALGEVLLNSGRVAEAEQALRGSISMRPDVSNQTALGFSLMRQSRARSALDSFRAVLQLAPGSVPAIYGAGIANEALDRNEEAIAHYTRLASVSAEELRAQNVSDLQRDAQNRLVRLMQPSSSDRRVRR